MVKKIINKVKSCIKRAALSLMVRVMYQLLPFVITYCEYSRQKTVQTLVTSLVKMCTM